MKSGLGFRLQISVRTDLPPHPHDARILELAKELRRLIFERAAARISAAHKGKRRPKQKGRGAFFSGKHHTPETKARIAKALRGKKKSDDVRDAISRGKRARAARKHVRDPWAAAIFGDRA